MEDARIIADGFLGTESADPVEQREIIQPVAAACRFLEGFHEQNEHRNKKGDNEEDDKECEKWPFRFSELHDVAARSLAPDGSIGLSRTDERLIGVDTSGSEEHH